MITSQKGALIISQPRNPFAWSSFDPVTRSKVITVESGLGTLIPDMVYPGASSSLGPGLAATGAATPASVVWPLGAQAAFFIPFSITVPVTVYKMFTYNGGTVAGNVDVGIYDASLNRLISIGSTAQAGVSQLQLFDVTDTELNTGIHYLALSADTATATFFMWTYTATRLASVLGQRFSNADNFPLPSTITFDAINSSLANIPLVGAIIRNNVS